MSKFYTPFPFPIEDYLKKLLPKGSFFECIKWNKEKNQLELHWEHDPYWTGRDHAIEFTPQMLERGQLPEGIGTRPVEGEEEEESPIAIGCSDPIQHPDGCACQYIEVVPPEQNPAAQSEAVATPQGVSGQVATGEPEKVQAAAPKRKGRTH